MSVLNEYDVVRVARLQKHSRSYTGTTGVMRAPQVGDVATICHKYEPSDAEAPVAVEMLNSDGLTIWLADFLPCELELVRSP